MIFREENETLWEVQTDYLMHQHALTQIRLLIQTKPTDLEYLFHAALNREDYEICSIIKKIKEKRILGKPHNHN